MESSEEDDDFPTHEWVTPQTRIDSLYQSKTEMGIRRLCSELLDLKDSVENLCGNMHSKYLAFLRISEEVIEMEQELIELQKHISAQGILVQDLMSGVCRELEVWNQANVVSSGVDQDLPFCESDDPIPCQMEDPEAVILETIDVLLAEHKIEEAISTLDAEEKRSPELLDSGDKSSTEVSRYKSAFLKRKGLLVEQLVEIAEQPSVGLPELKKALSGLLKLGKGPSAHHLLLKAYGFRLQKSVENFLPSCSLYSETFSATLSRLVFSTISLTAKESRLIFGDEAIYTNKLVQWAEWQIESFIQTVKENAPSSETVSGLRAASICVQAGLGHCSILETQGLHLSKFLMVLLPPYFEEVFDMNFRRARGMIIELVGNDVMTLLSPHSLAACSFSASSNAVLTNSGEKFMSIIKDIVDQLTPMAVSHFGGSILQRLSQLFDKYIHASIKALPGPSEDDSLAEQKDGISFRAETDAQQLALLGNAFTVADELLPTVASKICGPKTESKDRGSEPAEYMGVNAGTTIEVKDWKRHLQHSLDKLRDHFCRQYVLNFIYSGEGKTRLDARMYLNGKADDLFWDSDPLPTLPFQALFAKLQQLASAAGDVLIGREKIQKILLARLTETVVMWLSDEQDFWEVFEDDSVRLQPFGLQQLILDMHFVVEIAVCGGYPSRHVHQIVSAIITRAIRTFSARGIDPNSALPEDEWFVDTAKAAISKLLMVTSESSGPDEDHIAIHSDHSDSDDTAFSPTTIHSDHSDSDDTAFSPTTIHSVDSFASADMGGNESPVYFTDPET